jgi:hypothetical protein
MSSAGSGLRVIEPAPPWLMSWDRHLDGAPESSTHGLRLAAREEI